MSAFVTHFASLLTQIPLSDNWKKTVIYFTTVASVRCHDVFFFFFLVMFLTNFKVMLATSFLDSMYSKYQQVLVKTLVADITTFSFLEL